MPRWDDTNKRWHEGDDIVPAASAARTTNGDSGWIDSQDYDSVELALAVTVVGGDADETLDVVVETASTSGGANTRQAGAFAQRTQPAGAGTERKTFDGLDRFYRVRWTLAGTTPAFTFSVQGDAK